MKKVVAYIILLFFIIIYIICYDEDLLKLISKYKYSSTSLIGSDKYKYGDLFGLSFIPSIKENRRSDSVNVLLYDSLAENKINLFLVHDSYLSNRFLSSNSQIPGADTIYNFEYPWRRGNHSPPVTLDTFKTNLLVFEIVERNFFDLAKPGLAKSLIKIKDPGASKQIVATNESFFRNANQLIFNKKGEINLAFILFDTRIFTPLKELKAYMNLRLFNRTDPGVFLSSDNSYLFLKETKTSIETEISETELKKAIKNLNEIYIYYKNSGFDEVFLSIIPNPVSIIEPDCQKYNNLVPLIQGDNDLQMPFIDIYSIFKKTNRNIYYHSDSHWNKNGCQLWLNELNRIISHTKSKNEDGSM